MKETYKGFEIEIEQDEFVESPREWCDCFGTMVCWHRRYDLGDGNANPDNLSPTDFLKTLPKGSLVYGLWLLDHSGLSMRMGQSFSVIDPGEWDSGQVGFIYVTPENIRKEFSIPTNKKITKKIKEEARKILEAEVHVYSQYLEGDVWYFNTSFDSIHGFYGYKECLEAAKEEIDYHIKKKTLEHLKKLKAQIKNKVPLKYRKPLTIGA